MRLLMTLIVLAAATQAAGQDYQVDARVWIDGTLRGEPSVIVEPDKEAMIEIDQGDTGWRMNVLVEAPMAHEGAGEGAIWIRVGIAERIDGEWQFLTDSMLGVREGQPGVFSVVEPGVETATPENARMYVEMTARAVALDPQ